MTDLLEIADELYALPLGEFTPARDARAKEHKGTDLGKQVKALKKPSLAAWVVNLFVRRAQEQLQQVLDVGAALREAQAGMSGDELRALTRQRRQLTAAITQQARSLAKEEGVKVTDAVADQVEGTLTAAMVSEVCGEAVRSGLLVAAIATTGMDDPDPTDAVAVPEALGHAAAPREAEPAARPDLRVVPDPDAAAKARAAAEEALAEAEVAVAEAQQSHDDAVADVGALEARQLQIQAEIDELKRRIAELEDSCDEVDEELAGAQEAAADTEDVVREARRQRDAARKALDALPDPDSP